MVLRVRSSPLQSGTGAAPGAAAAPCPADAAVSGRRTPQAVREGRPETHPREFHSILYPGLVNPERPATDATAECRRNLNLDPIIDAITAHWQEYNLRPLFLEGPADPGTIRYRQAIMSDLEDQGLHDVIQVFAGRMHAMRLHLPEADKYYYRHQRERWFLEAATLYVQAVEGLARDLARLRPRSRGLRCLRVYLRALTRGAAFRRFASRTRQLRSDLQALRYTLIIKEDRVTVRHDEPGVDYSGVIEETFKKFRRRPVKDYSVTFPEQPWMNHVGAQILERVARLYPTPFQALDAYHADYAAALDATVLRFDREIHFYIAYLAYLSRFQRAGLPFCLPRLSAGTKLIDCRGAFDLALAQKCIADKVPVVCNDFSLGGEERLLVVTGPNQGGKTTFARMFGQMHYLAGLGCAVPGTRATLFHCDRIYTHFERRESIARLRGHFKDDLIRLREILDQATRDSIIIMNETFSSTTHEDALATCRKIMARLARLDAIVVCVTFLAELADFDEATVSMVGGVDPRDPTIRTYRLERRPADGLAYALAIAGKYRLGYEDLLRRIAP